ncbi:uncharacterized protein LACBIDRAFT_312467 [Laccaria bicolor S238N-H82]|uniref:Predicted protein n=1 Tax=Laccaria bicolor (strain S238N-H82 / ATCC MYA-4686) TaxID=486041 RepID=B0DW89_LACBS|nr:uncharacterized protein LACBIDRAFT_312467 [Laccaria bicolor S238N-H82]EDR01146.1 predicted protein [Laccaria bicolor S238N-H82]|eukprot:XP_001888188.1 predicted protein [Laccaria bicolor S238N-H82]
MPAARTRTSRLSGNEFEEHSLWTAPAPPVSGSSIAFTTNVTPGTFNDPLPQVIDDSPCESLLFPPQPPGYPAPRRQAHSKKKPENHIPRPPNAFILFRSSFIKSQHVSTEVETNHSTLSKIIGLTWQNLPNEERQVWHAKAKLALDEHKRKFPQYAFRPLHNKNKGGEKRKVREVGPKDHKRCEKIAELLVKGKKGQDLDAAIQEFDKYHVPEIVTRFETPITSQSYNRRPSSGSKPETSAGRSRRRRSSSSQVMRQSSPSRFSPSSYPLSLQLERDDVSDSLYTIPSFDQYPFPLKQEPSFDFETFPFDPSLPLFPCDSLSPAVHPQGGLHAEFADAEAQPPRLSIDATFTPDVNTWTRCDSPLSASSGSMPTTPPYIDSPSPDGYHGYNIVDSATPHYSRDDGLPQFPSYPDCSDHFVGSESFPTAPSGFHSYHQGQGKADAIPDLDFSSLMASLPPYAL